MDAKMYDTLTAVPLLKGMNGSDLNRLLDIVSLKISVLEEGDIWLQQGEQTDELTFLLDGSMSCKTVSQDKKYSLTEDFPSPAVLELDSLFGINRTSHSTYTANEVCHLMSLSKKEMNKMLINMEVFRLNTLNILCTLASRRRLSAWQTQAPQLSQRIIQFIKRISLTPNGHKILEIRMQDLGELMGATRSLIGSTLHKMQDQGILTMQRGIIDIPNIEDI